MIRFILNLIRRLFKSQMHNNNDSPLKDENGNNLFNN